MFPRIISALAAAAALVSGCAQEQIATSSITQVIETPKVPAVVEPTKSTRFEPRISLSPETKREWCQLRDADIRAGRPPLGETQANQVAAGNALCRLWNSSLAAEPQN